MTAKPRIFTGMKQNLLVTSVFYFLIASSTLYGEPANWVAMAGAIYALPVALLFFKSGLVRSYAYWIGIFLCLQILLSYWLIDQDFVTLTPNMNVEVDVQGGLPGISGMQHITTDEMGFRVTRKIDYSKNEGLRLFAIGGSTTEQIYLDDHDTWTHILQEQLQTGFGKNVEVINTGVAGLRARNHLSTLRKIRGMHPDMAIILVGVNDWNRQIRANFGDVEKESKLLRFQQTILGKTIRILYGYVKTIGKPKANQEKRVDHGEYYEKQRDSLSRTPQYRFRPQSVSVEYIADLDRIGMECKRSKISCLFVTQPTAYQKETRAEFKKLFWMTPPNEKYSLDFDSMIYIAELYNKYLEKFALENGHHICNLADNMPASMASYYDDCHFNTAGAKRVAQHLLACVKRVQTTVKHQ